MRLLTLLLSCFPLVVLAQQETVDLAAVDPMSVPYLAKLTGGLLLVVVVIFGLAWLMKRMNLTQHSQNGLLRIIAGLPLGTRDRIVLLQIGEEQILLGLSPGRIQKLHTLSSPINYQQEQISTTSFSQKFDRIMGKKVDQ